MYMHNEDLHIETSSTGARICTLQKGSKHFFYPQQIINKESGIVMRGGMHICSPIFGSPEGKGIFSSAPQHGELRNVFWDHNYFDDRERNFSYEYRHWGMSIDYDVSYLISGNRLDIDTEIFNCEKFPVPIEFGWHPYFNAPDGGEVKFVDNDISDIVIQQTYGSKVFPATDTILIKLNGIGTVRMELTEGFNKGNVCVWTDWRQKYFCVEPLLSYHEFDTENRDNFFLIYPRYVFIVVPQDVFTIKIENKYIYRSLKTMFIALYNKTYFMDTKKLLELDE